MKKILGLVFGLLFALPAFATDLDPCRNLFDGQIEQGMLTSGNPHATDSWIRSVNMTPVIPNTKYTVSFDTQGSDSKRIYVFCYNQQGVFTTRTEELNDGASFTTPGDCYNIKLEFQKGNPTLVSQFLWAQLERGETATEYAPYDEIMCYKKIKIATKKYNDTAFSPVVTALNGAITTIKSVVTNTINQAAAVSALQTGKQTMPNATGTNGTCPNYKQCLLVETSDGKPQWFVITDPFRDFVTPILATNTAPSSTTDATGYTQLEYIESTGTQYIDTGISSDSGDDTIRINIDIQSMETDESRRHVFGRFGNGANYVMDDNGIWSNGVATSHTSSRQKTNIDAIFMNRTLNMIFNGDDILNRSDGYTSADNVFQFCGVHSGLYSSVKIWNAKIWKNNTLVRDFVPVRQNATGKYGMYDKVNNQFYANASGGSNDFVPGPEVLDQDPAIPGMTWTATWTANANGVAAGTVNGVARCTSVTTSNTSSTANPTRYSQLTSAQQTQFNTPFTASTVSNYNVCWCKITDINTGGESASSSTANWTHYGIPGNNTVFDCTSGCTQRCRSSMGEFATRAGFIKAMFGQ